MSKKEKKFPINTTGGRIQHLRHKIGLTRSQFYDAIRPGKKLEKESKARTALHWESGETELDYAGIVAACKVLDCDSDYLLLLQSEPHKEEIQIADKTGLSYNAAEALVELAEKENKTEKEIESCDMFLYLISALILSDVPDCIAPAIYTKGREGHIVYNRKEWETYSAYANVSLQKTRAQESLFRFINEKREENGLDPLR
ncbi:MAG: hypothetical protein LUE26_03880 [Alistipes sp.]|nr:hypothetical protein [Alistipes sp.]